MDTSEYLINCLKISQINKISSNSSHNFEESLEGNMSQNSISNENQIKELIIKLIQKIQKKEDFDKSLYELSKQRENFKDIAVYVYYSTGIMTILIQQIIEIYSFLDSPNLSIELSNRVCNILTLFQCIASHKETRMAFIKSFIPIFIYPFLNSVLNSKPIEHLRLTTLGVIGALVKSQVTEIINFLINTEMVQLSVRIIEKGSDLSRTVATFILQRIICEDNGLNYICNKAERFFEIITVISQMITPMTNPRLTKNILKCFCRFSEHAKVKGYLLNYIPKFFFVKKYHSSLEENSKKILNLLFINLKTNPAKNINEPQIDNITKDNKFQKNSFSDSKNYLCDEEFLTYEEMPKNYNQLDNSLTSTKTQSNNIINSKDEKKSLQANNKKITHDIESEIFQNFENILRREKMLKTQNKNIENDFINNNPMDMNFSNSCNFQNNKTNIVVNDSLNNNNSFNFEINCNNNLNQGNALNNMNNIITINKMNLTGVNINVSGEKTRKSSSSTISSSVNNSIMNSGNITSPNSKKVSNSNFGYSNIFKNNTQYNNFDLKNSSKNNTFAKQVNNYQNNDIFSTSETFLNSQYINNLNKGLLNKNNIINEDFSFLGPLNYNEFCEDSTNATHKFNKIYSNVNDFKNQNDAEIVKNKIIKENNFLPNSKSYNNSKTTGPLNKKNNQRMLNEYIDFMENNLDLISNNNSKNIMAYGKSTINNRERSSFQMNNENPYNKNIKLQSYNQSDMNGFNIYNINYDAFHEDINNNMYNYTKNNNNSVKNSKNLNINDNCKTNTKKIGTNNIDKNTVNLLNNYKFEHLNGIDSKTNCYTNNFSEQNYIKNTHIYNKNKFINNINNERNFNNQEINLNNYQIINNNNNPYSNYDNSINQVNFKEFINGNNIVNFNNIYVNSNVDFKNLNNKNDSKNAKNSQNLKKFY